MNNTKFTNGVSPIHFMTYGVMCAFSLQLVAFGQSPPQPAALQPDKFLAWDADSKEYKPQPGEASAHFRFCITNISSEDVIISNIVRSCGCTEARLPEQPWRMLPGTNGELIATIDLRGKSGPIVKTLTVNSSVGVKTLRLNVNVPPPPTDGGSFNVERGRNAQLALADHQAVFKGDCAKCHAEPTVGKMGKELYQAGCAICHDAEHRAAMVPDLRALPHPTNAAHWKTWIASGRPGSMMPAFAKSNGGPLDDEQINSLVAYLAATIPSASATAN